MPTVLLASLDVPDGLDGIDLSPWLQTDPQPELEGREVYLESLYAYRHYGWAPQKAFVTDDYKLIDSTTPELYGSTRPSGKKQPCRHGRQNNERTIDDSQAMTTQMVISENTADRAELSPERLEQLAASATSPRPLM